MENVAINPISNAVSIFQSKFNISPKIAEIIPVISGYEIIILVDNSGSMIEYDPEFKRRRWDVLNDYIRDIINITAILDQNGVDVAFINGPTVTNVREFSQVEIFFQSGPDGRTPIAKRLEREFVRIGINSEKKY